MYFSQRHRRVLSSGTVWSKHEENKFEKMFTQKRKHHKRHISVTVATFEMYKNTWATFCQPCLPPFWVQNTSFYVILSGLCLRMSAIPSTKAKKNPTVFHLHSLTLRVLLLLLPSSAKLLLSVFSSEVWTGSWILFCKVKPWLWYEGYERLSVKWCLDIFSQLVVILYLYLQGNIWHTNVHECK